MLYLSVVLICRFKDAKHLLKAFCRPLLQNFLTLFWRCHFCRLLILKFLYATDSIHEHKGLYCRAGSTGITGPVGATGQTGKRGLTGATGQAGVAMVGAQGPIGPQGPMGNTGPQGGTGFSGSMGAVGIIGRGLTGEASGFVNKLYASFFAILPQLNQILVNSEVPMIALNFSLFWGVNFHCYLQVMFVVAGVCRQVAVVAIAMIKSYLALFIM